jgi:hypothetical protein
VECENISKEKLMEGTPMATSERIFHLRHAIHQPFTISFACRIAVNIPVALSMEPLDG